MSALLGAALRPLLVAALIGAAAVVVILRERASAAREAAHSAAAQAVALARSAEKEAENAQIENAARAGAGDIRQRLRDPAAVFFADLPVGLPAAAAGDDGRARDAGGGAGGRAGP